MKKVYVGKGSIYKLKDILHEHKPKIIFLVTGKNSYKKCGAKSILDDLLQNYNVVHFYDFKPNPQLDDIKRGLDVFRGNKCDFVIAVGGEV